MNITKKQIGVHLINWIIAVALFILFFINFFGDLSVWDMASEISFLFILLILPLVLAGLGLVKTINDKYIHLGWVIISAMTIGILMMVTTIMSTLGSFGSVFGYGRVSLGFVFWLIMILYLSALVYNSLALLGKADDLQKTLGEKTGPTLNNLKEKTKNLQKKPVSENQKDTRVRRESEIEVEETTPHLEVAPHEEEIKPDSEI